MNDPTYNIVAIFSSEMKSVTVWKQNSVELISVEKFVLPALGHGHLSHIIIGDSTTTAPYGDRPPQTTVVKSDIGIMNLHEEMAKC